MPSQAPRHYDPHSPLERPVALPHAPIRQVNERISIQPPLSRRGHGPGILLLLPPTGDDRHSALPESDNRRSKKLDPEPVQKWAEEGFAVAFSTAAAASPLQAIDTVLDDVAEAFESLGGDVVDVKGRSSWLAAYDASQLESLPEDTRFVCIAAFGLPAHVTDARLGPAAATKPVLLHIANSEGTYRGEDHAAIIHAYPAASASFVIPSSTSYDPSSAALAHTRTLVFLREHLGGPRFDLEKIWDEHCYFEFEERSVAKTMGTMVAEPYVNHVPTMTGGVGREALTQFYRDHFIFSNPIDARLQLVSRTVGPDRVVDEFIFHITHDRTVDWLLPQVPPTGEKLAIPMVAVVNIRGDRLYNEHIWWDQATVLRQCGILPTHLPHPTPEGTQRISIRLPVAGAESARMLVNESRYCSNEMLCPEWTLSAQESQ